MQGTITHMSPERLSVGRMSPAADVYAFGMMSKQPTLPGQLELA
jgi:serine/threonine protein kinase